MPEDIELTPIPPQSRTPRFQPAEPEPAPTDAALRRALRRARDGAALDVAETSVLLHARGEHLDELLNAAARVRDAHLTAEGRPGIVTYSRKVFIPLTRLCRDRCHYCTFVTVPHRVPDAYLDRDEVLEIARQGAALGCKEALFTLGDRPEERWPQAREWLDARGYSSTVDYLRSVAIAVLEETGLLPHLNPGVLSWEELTRLRPVAPSMGMMLETTANRLWSEPGAPHYGSLNPILQDPGLAFHPPMLYLGYVGFSITFSFAIAALLEGRIDAAWARWVRPWVLVAWMCLTLGIAGGSYWSYYELGWGGFSFWDPVENASLMPWLAGTALLHSAVVMEKREALKVWTVLLAILAFSLSLMGTFLVRSGVLSLRYTPSPPIRRAVFSFSASWSFSLAERCRYLRGVRPCSSRAGCSRRFRGKARSCSTICSWSPRVPRC